MVVSFVLRFIESLEPDVMGTVDSLMATEAFLVTLIDNKMI